MMTTSNQKSAVKAGFLKDIQVKQMSTGTLSEKLQGLPGTIYFERRESGVIEVYLRYTPRGGSRRKRKIGAYRSSERGGGLSLSEVRAKARELGEIARDHGDIEAYFALQAERADLTKREAERLLAAESARSTFTELFRDYIEDRTGKVMPDQIRDFENYLRGDFLESFPEIMAMKARDVEPRHIQEILNRVWNRGAKRQTEKIRSALHAAFAYGLKCEYAVGKRSDKTYGLRSNPVSSVPVPTAKKPKDRALSDEELKLFWHTIAITEGVGPVVAAAMKFAIATGGQRIDQIVRREWSSYNPEEKTFSIIDKKGRNSKPRLAVLPLTGRAIAILEGVRSFNGPNCTLPFSTNGKARISSSTFAHAVALWFESDHSIVNGKRVPKFTPGDFRRTVAQIMQAECISNEDSDLLQGHGLSGLVADHYRNDPQKAVPKNRKTVDALERALVRILDSVKEGEPNEK